VRTDGGKGNDEGAARVSARITALTPSLSRKLQALARRQLVELKNGRLAMIATSGMLHHYFLTGKGPIELITG
jgi:hypothetical protein